MPEKKKDNTLYYLIGAALVFLLLPKKTNDLSTPRSIRNNNPGNIKINPTNNCTGKVPIEQNTDGVFEQFTSWIYGVRALIKLIVNYQVINDLHTIKEIINKFDPGSILSPSNYVQFVSDYANQPSDKPFISTERMTKLITQAIADFESGRSDVISDNDFSTAWAML